MRYITAVFLSNSWSGLAKWVLIGNNFTLAIYIRDFIFSSPVVPSIVRSGTCLIEFALVALCVALCELIANHVTRYSPTHSVLVKGPTMDIVCYSSFVRLFGVICPRTLAIEIDLTYLVHEISRSISIIPIWFTRPRDRDRSYLFGLRDLALKSNLPSDWLNTQ